MKIIYPTQGAEDIIDRNAVSKGGYNSVTQTGSGTDTLLTYTCPAGKKALVKQITLVISVTVVDTTTMITNLRAVSNVIATTVKNFVFITQKGNVANTRVIETFNPDLLLVAGDTMDITYSQTNGTGNGATVMEVSYNLTEFDA